MDASITPEGRTANESRDGTDRPVTLMNSFLVPEGRDDEFLGLWQQTSEYFRKQPGFLSLRLHRVLTPDAPYRFVNVARWASDAHYRAPHGTDEFRALVNQAGWHEFPSRPLLYEVVLSVGDDVSPS